MLKNVLNRAEARRLEDLVQEHQKEIQEGRWTKTAFAAMAGKKLGRPVSPGNVKGAAGVFGLAFPRPVGSSHGHSRSLTELRAAVVLLARELVAAKGEMGMLCSPTLQALAQTAVNGEAPMPKQ